MFNRWRVLELRWPTRLNAGFIACCVVLVAGSLTAHSASFLANGAGPQVDPLDGPFVMVGVPFAIGSNDIALSDDGHTMIAVESRPVPWKMRRARVWDLALGKATTGPLSPASYFYGLSFDGRIAYTTDRDHICVWDVATSRLLWTKQFHLTGYGGIAMSRDGKQIAAASEADNSVKVWQVGSDQPRLSIKQSDTATSVDFDRTGKRIATISDGALQIYDAQTGEQAFPQFLPQSDWDLKHHFDLTGKRFLKLRDYGATVLDTTTGKTLLTIESKHNVGMVRWSVDSDKIVLVAMGEAAQIYDASTGKLDRTIASSDIRNLWIMPGSRWAVCQRDREPLEVWDLATGNKVQTLTGSLHCDPDPVSSTLVTTNGEKLVKIWRLRSSFK